MAKTKNRKRKTRKLNKLTKLTKLTKINEFKGGAESSRERETPLYLGAEERNVSAGENQSGYASNRSNATYESNTSNKSNASNKTEIYNTEIGVFNKEYNVRNKNISLKSPSYSVIDMDIKDLKLPIYPVEGNGPIRKINFYKDDINIGYAAFTYMNPIFEIHTLYINENQRSSGYGKRILKFLIQYAFEQLDVNEMQLNDQTNSRIFNPSQHRNKMYTKSKFVQMKSKNYNKWMSLKKYRYKKFKRTIFSYLNSKKK